MSRSTTTCTPLSLEKAEIGDHPATHLIPIRPDALLRRSEAVAALRAAGYPVADRSLATMACRGGGPLFRRFGKRPLYRWADVLAWAEARLTPTVSNTSQFDVIADLPRASADAQV